MNGAKDGLYLPAGAAADGIWDVVVTPESAGWGYSSLRVLTVTPGQVVEFVGTAVGCYITGAYWFTASTSFANPAVAIARAFSDTFSGIRPIDLPGFIAAEVAGGLLAIAYFGCVRGLIPFYPVAGVAAIVVFLVLRQSLKKHPDGRFFLSALEKYSS